MERVLKLIMVCFVFMAILNQLGKCDDNDCVFKTCSDSNPCQCSEHHCANMFFFRVCLSGEGLDGYNAKTKTRR